ncbi:hypothetical protein QQF64_035423 [Cirrhinus molitorella]|uniref:Uncharacterized protein n=1 Tax=Cirrhinus molitorella TaxID=172907 RepID=A0ABR3NGM7_9TELE
MEHTHPVPPSSKLIHSHKEDPNVGTLCEVNDPSLLGVPLMGCLFESCIEATGHHFAVAYIKLMRMEEERERRAIVTSQ